MASRVNGLATRQDLASQTRNLPAQRRIQAAYLGFLGLIGRRTDHLYSDPSIDLGYGIGPGTQRSRTDDALAVGQAKGPLVAWAGDGTVANPACDQGYPFMRTAFGYRVQTASVPDHCDAFTRHGEGAGAAQRQISAGAERMPRRRLRRHARDPCPSAPADR